MATCNATYSPVLESHINYVRGELPLTAVTARDDIVDSIEANNRKALNLIVGISGGTLLNVYGTQLDNTNSNIFDAIDVAGIILNQLSFIILRVFRLRPTTLSCNPSQVQLVLQEHQNLLDMCKGSYGGYGQPMPSKVLKYQAKKLGTRLHQAVGCLEARSGSSVQKLRHLIDVLTTSLQQRYSGSNYNVPPQPPTSAVPHYDALLSQLS